MTSGNTAGVTRPDLAVCGHVLPFLAWVLLMLLPGEPAAWKYALRSAVGLALLLALRPWRWYEPPAARHIPLALAAGFAVFAFWVLPESAWFGRVAGGLQDLYLRYATDLRRLGQSPALPAAAPYAPAVCGVTLAAARLLGSALVIAPIEELFWRGFLYRALASRDFVHVDLGTLSVPRLLAVAACFGLEHDRWLAGLLAGLVYGWLAVRTRDLWAAVLAHALTNLLLGAYVLSTGAWQIW